MKARLATLSAFVAGLSFGVGLLVSGMTRPEKVIGFLDVFDSWDPSLAFVMLGAISVHAVLFRLIRRRAEPVFTAKWSIPTRRDIDLRLVAGAAIFGAGWGLGGYCPGPSLVALPSGAPAVVVFVVAMLAGMFAVGRIERRQSASAEAPPPIVDPLRGTPAP